VGIIAEKQSLYTSRIDSILFFPNISYPQIGYIQGCRIQEYGAPTVYPNKSQVQGISEALDLNSNMNLNRGAGSK
jgi:hypothetical protein